MYANVKLNYTVVTGPTGETRLVLPSSELRDCRPSGFRSATKCVRHLRFVYVERILLPGYLRRFRVMHAYKSYILFVVSRSEGRATQRLPSLPSRDVLAQAFPGRFQSVHPRAINYAPVRSGEGLGSRRPQRWANFNYA